MNEESKKWMSRVVPRTVVKLLRINKLLLAATVAGEEMERRNPCMYLSLSAATGDTASGGDGAEKMKEERKDTRKRNGQLGSKKALSASK